MNSCTQGQGIQKIKTKRRDAMKEEVWKNASQNAKLRTFEQNSRS
jgi:hypothetical protein